MANRLQRGDKTIWRCSNGLLEVMYTTLVTLANNEPSTLSNSIKDLIDHLDQETYGYGCIYLDLDDYLSTAKEWKDFALLVKKAINLAQQKYDWPVAVTQQAELFYHSLRAEI
jgi:hypothetical protein